MPDRSGGSRPRMRQYVFSSTSPPRSPVVERPVDRRGPEASCATRTTGRAPTDDRSRSPIGWWRCTGTQGLSTPPSEKSNAPQRGERCGTSQSYGCGLSGSRATALPAFFVVARVQVIRAAGTRVPGSGRPGPLEESPPVPECPPWSVVGHRPRMDRPRREERPGGRASGVDRRALLAGSLCRCPARSDGSRTRGVFRGHPGPQVEIAHLSTQGQFTCPPLLRLRSHPRGVRGVHDRSPFGGPSPSA
jgi:hypothetical protein